MLLNTSFNLPCYNPDQSHCSLFWITLTTSYSALWPPPDLFFGIRDPTQDFVLLRQAAEPLS